MHVIIAGAARSGKTTLSLMLNEYGFTHYKMDSIKRGICEFYKLQYDNWEDVSPMICSIINRIIQDNYTDTNYLKEKYLFDTPFITPKDAQIFNNHETKVIFLGYSNISVDKMVKSIRDNDLDYYWTSKKSDEELKKETIENIEFSRYLEKECKKYGIEYYDTSNNREIVLKQIVNDIINK